ncbi:EAL domain-containing protein [Acidithiobacillus ferriphilus]|uniref:EAL domain-containing protein n=1 Tax=Acidithiobacillus ferriphilus TaxID=1689834 RepID=UPI0027E03068|nr:EAL domain-containing protein [Acidithiobacillus ferriphilus]
MIAPPLTTMQRRTLWQVGIAFMFLASLLTALYIQQSEHLHRVVADKIKLHALLSAQSTALQVAAVFNKYFDNLVYVGNFLLPQNAGVQAPDTRTLEQVQILRAQYPDIMAINLQNSSGDRILWSTLPQSSRPTELANDFTPLPSHPNRLIGKLHYAQRMHAQVITMRYRVHDAGSTHLFFSVGSPINIMSLDALTIPPNYNLFLLDAQHVPFAFFRQGRLSLSGPSLQSFPPDNQVHEPVSGYPWTIAAGWPSSLVEQAWWDEEKKPLLNDIGTVLGLLGIGAFTLFLLAREMRLRNRQEEILIDERDHQKKLAIHDALTGLPNRDGLRLVFDQALARSDRQEQLLAVGFLDLDDFKPVNDTYGHAAGDDLLQEMARRLRNAVRRTDTIARLGGDEFILLLEGLRNVDELDQVLARLQAAIAQPFYIHGEVVSIRASLGLTLYPFDEGDADLLLRHADQAMYTAKTRPGRESGSWVQLYHPDIGNVSMGDEILRRDFLRSLASGAVTLRYQPLVAMATDRVAGLEALTRWHREGQEVSPERFLSALGVRERQALGRFVLQTGLRQLAQWREAGLDLFLSINVTPEELDSPGFADTVFGILAAYPGIPPESLVLEVLEIGEILEQGVALEHLQRLRGTGVKIALDDVGSAYASLLRLKNLPIDEIKIDQGFIRELSNKPQDLIFVESLVSLGLAMGVLITVEGVETEAHIALLREMKIDYLQGYAIARPLEAEAVADFVRTFVLGAGDADTPMLALYQHLGWVRAAAESAMNHEGYEHTELADCPITTWLHTHAAELSEVEALLAEHETVHALGRKILQVRQSGTREELHRLLGQLHEHSHRFQEGLGRAVKIMRDNASA